MEQTKSKLKQILVLTTAGMLAGSVAFAAPFAPTGTYGVALPAGSFGGGPGNIPTDNVTTFTSGGLTLGLGAHLRNVLPAQSLSAAGGVYQATAGISPYSTTAATWNLNFFIESTSGLGAYTYLLTYGTDGAGLVSFNPLAIGDNAGVAGISAGNSENLTFDFGGAPFPSGVLGPAIGFDPNENNVTYAFQLEAFSRTTNGITSVGKTAINVQVGQGGPGHNVPDAGSTCALLGMAFVGIAGLRRKFAV